MVLLVGDEIRVYGLRVKSATLASIRPGLSRVPGGLRIRHTNRSRPHSLAFQPPRHSSAIASGNVCVSHSYIQPSWTFRHQAIERG